MKLRDHSWLAIATPVALVVLILGCIVSLYVQTWEPMIISAALIGSILAISALTLLILDRVWRTPKPWECPHCRYDRRGLPRQAACPECGRDPDAIR